MRSLLFLLFILIVGSVAYFTLRTHSDTVVEIEQTAEQSILHPAQMAASNSKKKRNLELPKKDSPSKGKPLKAGNINWHHISDAETLSKKNDKLFLVDMYTDWCGWCEVMDRKTFTDQKLQEQLNQNYNLIKFDAEQKETIDYKGRNYKWIPSGKYGVHQLAIDLMDSRMSYPTLIILDNELNKLKKIAGYKKPQELLAELQDISI